MGFREDAVRAGEEQTRLNQADRQVVLQERSQQLAEHFERQFGYKPDSVDAEKYTVTIDNITIQHDGYEWWEMLLTCPACGETVRPVVQHLTDIGQRLNENEIGQYHACKASNETRQAADWPEWLQINGDIIHLPLVKEICLMSGGRVGMDMQNGEWTWTIALDGDAAAKFREWWATRQGRDDVVVL